MNITKSILTTAAFCAATVALAAPAVVPSTIYAQGFSFGQEHSYDTRLRGDGSAIVNARIEVKNTGEKPIKAYSYSVENGTLRDITAIQEISCDGLPTYILDSPTTDSGSAASPTVPKTLYGNDTTTEPEYPECYPKNNEQTTYYYGTTRNNTPISYIVPSYTSVYRLVPVEKKDNSFTLTLNDELAFNDRATFVLIYDLTDVADKQLGIYEYDFKTLKTKDRINNITVALSVDSGYVLEGATDEKINYNPESSGNDITESINNGVSLDSSEQKSTDAYVKSIGTNGVITKSADTLAAGETLTVSGTYASSEFLLHWPRTALFGTLIVVAIAACITWYRRRSKQLKVTVAEVAPTAVVDTASDSAGSSITADIDTQNESSQADVDISQVAMIPVVEQDANKQAFITIDVRALPFYGSLSRLWVKLKSRGYDYPLFGWMCAFFGIAYAGLVAWAYNAMIEPTYYYTSDTASTNVLSAAVTLCMTIVGIFGFLLITVGLPFVYAPTFRKALRIILNVVFFSLVIALVCFALFKITVDNSDDDYCDKYPYSSRCYTVDPYRSIY